MPLASKFYAPGSWLYVQDCSLERAYLVTVTYKGHKEHFKMSYDDAGERCENIMNKAYDLRAHMFAVNKLADELTK